MDRGVRWWTIPRCPNDWPRDWRGRCRARAQRALQPELSCGRYFCPAPADAREAAIVILLYREHGTWRLPLTLRADSLTDHAGQICLPGGSLEPGECSSHAALRELEEELGVDTRSVEFLGDLSPLWLYNSNFHVRSHVALATHRSEWRIQSLEVAALLEIPLADLLDPAARTTREHSRRGVRYACPGYLWRESFVWGFTSLVLAEFLAVSADALATD